MMKRNKISKEMKSYIEAVKATDFYKNFIDKLYTCKETPEILWATFKAPYRKIDEIAFWTEIEDFGFEFWDMIMADDDPRAAHYHFKEVK